jgi:hypothetical protein
MKTLMLPLLLLHVSKNPMQNRIVCFSTLNDPLDVKRSRREENTRRESEVSEVKE